MLSPEDVSTVDSHIGDIFRVWRSGDKCAGNIKTGEFCRYAGYQSAPIAGGNIRQKSRHLCAGGNPSSP